MGGLWLRVESSMHRSPLVLAIPRGPRRLAAVGLWTLAGTWLRDNDATVVPGLVPPGLPADLGAPQRAVADLVEVGLWEPADGLGRSLGWQYQGWDEPSAADLRADWRQRKARQRAREAAARPP